MSDHRIEITHAAFDVLRERLRQKEVEGWTAEHDDQHDGGELAEAAACYALASADPEGADCPLVALGAFWPWDPKWWKPGNRRRMLIKAGALILAEIERLDRAAAKAVEVERV